MADEFEFIIRAVDNASDVFKDVIETAQGMAEGVVDSISGAGDEFENINNTTTDFETELIALQEEFANATSEVERLEEALDEAYLNGDDIEADIIADELAEATARAEELSERISSIETGGLVDASNAADDFETEVEEAGDALDGLNNSAGDVMVAQTFREMSQGIADTMWGMVDSAGAYNDSLTRATLEAENFGISGSEMKDVVNEISESTGRAGGQIREGFIKASARGVTELDSFKNMMTGAGAQAFLLGTDIQTMADKFSSMAQKDTLMTRALAETGVTMEELGTAMGMTGATADEVKDKWKELDVNQRAAALGTAASMNEGAKANEEFKNSWEGLKMQMDIAKGRLERIAGDVLMPVLVPAMELAGRVLDGVGDSVSALMSGPASGLISILGTLAGGFLIAVTAAGFLKQMMGFLRVEEMITAGYQALLNVQNVLTGETSVMAALGLAAEGEAAGVASASFFGLSVAELAALWPLALIVAAIAAVIAIVYEVGKAFGWWTDVNTMIDAVWDGIQKLWNAFINHPDVQAVISAISGAWNWLISSITGVITAVADFFGINNAGNFDIVSALIDGIGQAWNMITLPIRVVYRLIQTLWGAFDGASGGIDVLGGLSWAWENLMNVINTVWTAVEPIFTLLMDTVGQIMETFDNFASGQIDLQTAVLQVWSILMTNIPTILTMISTLVGQFIVTIAQYAIQAGYNFVSNIINYISQLPLLIYGYLVNALSYIISVGSRWITQGVRVANRFVTRVISYFMSLPRRAYTYLINVVSRIVSAGSHWVSTARTYGSKVVTAVIDYINNLPAKVATEFGKIPDRIRNSVSSAVKAASNFGDNIKNAVLNALHIRSPGIIQKKIATEFANIPGRILESARSAYNTAYNYGRSIISGYTDAGTELDDIGLSSYDLETGQMFDIRTGEYILTDEDSTIEVEETINLILDLRNVPDGIDIDVLIEALTNNKVLEALVNNKRFQELDTKVKTRILQKLKRSGGA